MSYKKTIFIVLIIFLLGVIIPKVVQAEENACQQWCISRCGEYNPDLCRQIGKGGSAFYSGSVCSCCQKIGDAYYCTCQGFNKVEDCHVGFLISNPVCACCGDCVLNDFLLMGVNATENVLGFLGVFALLFFVIGGIIWITSGGSAEKVKKGKDMIKGAIVGLIIVLIAFTIVRVVMEAFDTEEYLPSGEKCTVDSADDATCRDVGATRYNQYVSEGTGLEGYNCKLDQCEGATTICCKRRIIE